ncbi:MAG: SGNH/GDSL hydrolase family protein [Clostridiales bacterium]|nr:SGNH/GDSL hydrolase family protein [Clostridiales bacterium]
MKKVLLIGDSIRLSYDHRVRELLKDEAEVWGPDDNCRFTKYTLWEINGWIGHFGKPDIIHWNNGIWDTFKIADDIDPFTPLDEYLYNLEKIYGIMKRSGAKILFALTTPVRRQLLSDNIEKIRRYNEAASGLMKKLGVPVNDLYSLISSDIDGYIGDDCLHLNEKGVEAAARQTADFIRGYLDQN